MAKSSTFPTLYDECKSVSISFLKAHSYLNPGQWYGGSINWSRNGNIIGSIGIRVNTIEESPYLELDYKYNENPIKYRVPLISMPSNIGKGVIWFFICPNTGKLCRKLYLVGGYFLHRAAFRSCMYEKQTYSHKNRILCKQFEVLFSSDNICEELYGKHFKKHYKGKPTKRYIKLMKRLKESDSIDEKSMLKYF